MNGTMLLTIVIAVIALLIFLAYLLDRRSKKKGNMLFGGNDELVPAQGKYTYIFLALIIFGTIVLIYGFYIHSVFLQILGGILFVVSIGLRWFWTIKTLMNANKKK
jgi:preprotein translocase subunit SecG